MKNRPIYVVTGIDNDEEKEDHKKEHTMETAWVGVFEGWLYNQKNEPLRWKLVDNRPAWEFPAMAMGKPLNYQTALLKNREQW